VTYHNSRPNFAKRFGIEAVNFVEPKAGVPPSPRHIQAGIPHPPVGLPVLRLLMGTPVSLIGMYGSYRFDTPTGATVICVFGLALSLMGFVARFRGGRSFVPAERAPRPGARRE